MTRLIDADALIPQMESDASEIEDPIASMFTYAAINDIKHAPTVEAEPVRHGHWEFGENEYGDDGYYCSACHGHVVWKYDTESIDFIKEYNYCPFCCAKMGERYF